MASAAGWGGQHQEAGVLREEMPSLRDLLRGPVQPLTIAAQQVPGNPVTRRAYEIRVVFAFSAVFPKEFAVSRLQYAPLPGRRPVGPPRVNFFLPSNAVCGLVVPKDALVGLNWLTS